MKTVACGKVQGGVAPPEMGVRGITHGKFLKICMQKMHSGALLHEKCALKLHVVFSLFGIKIVDNIYSISYSILFFNQSVTPKVQ